MILTVEAPVREALVTKMTVQMTRAGVMRYMGQAMVKHVVLYLLDNGWTHEPTVREAREKAWDEGYESGSTWAQYEDYPHNPYRQC